MTIDTPITATDAALQRVLANPQPTLLILHQNDLASNIQNRLKDIAKQEAGQLLVVKMNTSENPAAAQQLQANGHSLTAIAYRDQQELARSTAAHADTLQAYADYLLGRRDDLPKEPAKPRAGNSKPVAVSDADFAQQVLGSDRPVLVDFWAEWCGPCRMIAPTLEKLAGEFGDQITIAKLNVDHNPQTAMQYRIQGIPALKLFKNGQVVDEVVGAAPEPMLRQFVQRHI